MLSASQYFFIAVLAGYVVTFYSLLMVLKLTPLRDYSLKKAAPSAAFLLRQALPVNLQAKSARLPGTEWPGNARPALSCCGKPLIHVRFAAGLNRTIHGNRHVTGAGF